MESDGISEIIGVGATAKLYEYGDKKVFKWFRRDLSDRVIEEEYRCTQAVQGLSVHAPKVYELVSDGIYHGYVMEKLTGDTLLDKILHGSQENVTGMCVEFAKLHAQMHQIKGIDLPEGHDWLKRRISWSSDLSQKEKEKLNQAIDELPHQQCLCHNDYHPGNLFVTAKDYRVIDWCDACSGNPWMDVARTTLMFQDESIPEGCSEEEAEQIMRARGQMGKLYREIYLEAIGSRGEELEQWMPLVAASRLFVETGKVKQSYLAMVREYLD